MPSAPIPATPDLMMLLCLVARVMRGGGPSNLGRQLLLIGALCPAFGGVLRTWLDVEEHVARAPESDDPWWGVGADDGAVRSGWIGRTGMVWRWRQVTRTGARVMLVRWFAEPPLPDAPRVGVVRAPSWSVALPVRRFVFPAGLGAGQAARILLQIVNIIRAAERALGAMWAGVLPAWRIVNAGRTPPLRRASARLALAIVAR